MASARPQQPVARTVAPDSVSTVRLRQPVTGHRSPVTGHRSAYSRSGPAGALIIVLSFCGCLAWLGGPGPYIGGLIAVLDLGAMFGMFFGLRPEGLPDTKRTDRKRLLPPHVLQVFDVGGD
jgi:hypothetical protein